MTLRLIVADEIECGLFMMNDNDTVALRYGSSRKAKPEDLDDSARGVRHMEVEKERRDAAHEALRRMSFFFKAPPRLLSRNKVLFFGESTTFISNRIVTYHDCSGHYVSDV